ncbi:MAG: hypothetical protein WC277_12640 [Bacilli bacterium]|jgi:hypothetical protein
MPSLVTAKTIQAYEPFLREIADRVGNDPFFAQDLRAQGVAVPHGQIFRTLGESKCLIRVERVNGAIRWRLAPGVQEFLQGARAR